SVVCLSTSLFLCRAPRSPPTAAFVIQPGHHPPLHSFPTRRSSDLPLRRRGAAGAAGTGAGAHAPYAHPGRAPLRRGRGGHDAAQDRKSTRLNSSHVSISYAVFCLKKKITYTDYSFLTIC